ncbi:uncharacterized protein ACA1_046520 [Acanthamoeba castellanii str. Neff]|uniref:Uncharacterized protein n=1 Tax=Acanthamoeba castellanii (strain ATCC 30010 / Neff) TaxID=1257118 RepID=L8H9K3_ACACF|nr:uncharacterized protein ACA1_046520 [Acanthamoeba castellanii str. Neff]ELR21932.1 hypothetical protein ACA1_046520 [Acanthamoeba castellanii str. Neff]
MATPRQVSQLKSFLACNPNKKLLLLCKELGMEGYSRLSRSDLEKMFINHLQQHPDQFSHMIGLLSGAERVVSKPDRRSPPGKGQCERVAPVTFVHRVRHDRPKEAHPDEYGALERYSESGQEEQFWAVVVRSQHQHHNNPDIIFFLEYKICEFNIYQNKNKEAFEQLLRLKGIGSRSPPKCTFTLEHWYVRKYQSELAPEDFHENKVNTLTKCTELLLGLLRQYRSYLSHYDEGDAYYNLAVIEPDDDKAQQYFLMSAEAFVRARCTNEAQRSHIRLLQRITRWRPGEFPHPPEATSASRRMLPSQSTPHLVTAQMRNIIRNLQTQEIERSMLPRTEVAFRMAVSDVWLRDGMLAEAEDQAKRALELCRNHPWSECVYAQERLANLRYIMQQIQLASTRHHQRPPLAPVAATISTHTTSTTGIAALQPHQRVLGTPYHGTTTVMTTHATTIAFLGHHQQQLSGPPPPSPFEPFEPFEPFDSLEPDEQMAVLDAVIPLTPSPYT